METIDFKHLSLEFREDIDDILSSLEKVKKRKIIEEQERQDIINLSKKKLNKYNELLNTLDEHFVKALKARAEDDMEYLQSLIKIVAE